MRKCEMAMEHPTMHEEVFPIGNGDFSNVMLVSRDVL